MLSPLRTNEIGQTSYKRIGDRERGEVCALVAHEV